MLVAGSWHRLSRRVQLDGRSRKLRSDESKNTAG